MGDCNCTVPREYYLLTVLARVTDNGAKVGVRRGRRGGEAGTGSVEVCGRQP
jgi:hypothetical protein